MASNGFYLGGFAEGMRGAEEMTNQRQALKLDKRRLDIAEKEGAAQTELARQKAIQEQIGKTAAAGDALMKEAEARIGDLVKAGDLAGAEKMKAQYAQAAGIGVDSWFKRFEKYGGSVPPSYANRILSIPIISGEAVATAEGKAKVAGLGPIAKATGQTVQGVAAAQGLAPKPLEQIGAEAEAGRAPLSRVAAEAEITAAAGAKYRAPAQPNVQNFFDPATNQNFLLDENGASDMAFARQRGLVKAGVVVQSASVAEAISPQKTEIKDYRNAVASTTNLVREIETIKTELAKPETTTGLVGWGVRTGSAIVGQAEQIAEQFGDTAAVASASVTQHLEDLFGQDLRQSGAQAGVLRSRILSLAYLMARTADPSARALSDFDIKNQLDILGANAGDKFAMETILDDVARRSIANIETQRQVLGEYVSGIPIPQELSAYGAGGAAASKQAKPKNFSTMTDDGLLAVDSKSLSAAELDSYLDELDARAKKAAEKGGKR